MASHVRCLHLWFIIGLPCLCLANTNLMGKPGEGYYIEVAIGTPPQTFNVLVDTGSTNFAIAAAVNPNVDIFFSRSNSSTYKSHHKKVSVLYTQGRWDGELGSDLVYFSSLAIPALRCDIAAIQTSHNFYMNGSQWQGILGLAYPEIARPDRSVVSWLDALEHRRGRNVTFALKLCGADDAGKKHTGILEIVDGDTVLVDSGMMLTSPVVREWFYELLLSGINVGDRPVDLPCRALNTDKTILDSGTTSLRLPNEVFLAVVNLLNTSTIQQSEPMSDDFWLEQKMFCCRSPLDWMHFPNISLSLMHTDSTFFSLHLPPQSYIRQATETSETLGLQYCYKFSIETSSTGTVLGVVVMEGFHVIFNRSSKTVGFLKSSCGPPVDLSGPFTSKSNLKKSCLYPVPLPMSALTVAAYVVAALMSVCGVVLMYLLSQWLLDTYIRKKRPAASSSETSLFTDET